MRTASAIAPIKPSTRPQSPARELAVIVLVYVTTSGLSPSPRIVSSNERAGSP